MVQTLEARKQRIHNKLRTQRAQSELIYDIAIEMLEIDRLGLWQAESGTDKKRKKGGLTREAWVEQTFGISARQARKYFNIAEHLRREEIAGSGLCLDRMEQLALCPPALRPTLLALGAEEGLSARALSAGRRAALPLLHEGRLAQAIAEATKTVRGCAGKEDREDQKEGGKKPAAEGPEGHDEDEGPDAGYACELVAAALQELQDLAKRAEQPGSSGITDPGALLAVAEAADQLGQTARRLLEQLAAQKDPPAPEAAPAPAATPPTPEESPPAAEAAPPAPAGQSASPGGARKSPSAKISFTPLLAVLLTLSYEDQCKLPALLHAAMTNRPFSTAEIAAALRQAGAEPALVAAWEDLLHRPTHNERARFAFWFAQKAVPAWLHELLRIMDRKRLPPSLREQLEKEGLGMEAELR